MKKRNDGWSNIITGLTSAADKRRYTKAQSSAILTDDELEAIYIDDGLGARIIDAIPDDMFRQGWQFVFDDITDEKKQKEKAQKYIDIFDTLKLKTKLNLAYKWARLYGGAVVLLGALDGQAFDKPLNPKRIRYFDTLRVIDRSDIDFFSIQFQLDPLQPRYGLPVLYPIRFETGLGVQETRFVHFSRVLEVHGKIVPEGATGRLTREQRYWGLSELQKCYERLSTLGSTFGSIGHLLHQVSVGKYKFANLDDMLSAPNGKQMIEQRVAAMDMMQSAFRSLLLGEDDEFVRENIQFSGVAEVLYQFFMMLSADTGIPITRLFGVSPAGLNSTGESDQLNYYDVVVNRQEIELATILREIVHIVAEWQGIEEPNIVFNPLKQMTEKEKAELEKLKQDAELVKMQRYQGYSDMGVMESYMVEHLEFGDALQKIPVPEVEEAPEVEEIPPAADTAEVPEDNETPEDTDESEEDDPEKAPEQPDEDKEEETSEEDGEPEEEEQEETDPKEKPPKAEKEKKEPDEDDETQEEEPDEDEKKKRKKA